VRELPLRWQQELHGARAGEISVPIPLEKGNSCTVLKVVERRPRKTRPLAEVHDLIASRLQGDARRTLRGELIRKLGGTSGASVDLEALGQAVRGDPALSPHTRVVALAGETLVASDVRARLGNLRTTPGRTPAQFGAELAEDLVLWREAKRRGLAQHPEVRAAEDRAALEHARRALTETVAASITPEDVERVHRLNEGDYTELRAVRIAALVSRDRATGVRWMDELKRAQHPGDRFLELLAESEDLGARQREGDLGWIDDRTVAFPEAFRRVVLALEHPGQVFGPVAFQGVHYVLLCRDTRPARVKPLTDVEAEIRAKLLRRLLPERAEAQRAAWRARIRPMIDEPALRRLVTAVATK
jgi:hypothetical protein